jgi:hypothetical protein
MATIYIDLSEDESHWNGEINCRVLDTDTLTGANMALEVGGHEIILTVTQAITLFDLLDEWLNCGPVTELGAVRKRVKAAIEELCKDESIRLTKASNEIMSSERFAGSLGDYLRLKGLRYRLTGETEEDDFRHRRERRARERRDEDIRRAALSAPSTDAKVRG